MNGWKRAIPALLCAFMATACAHGALAEGYTYTVRIYAGAQGSFSGADMLEYSGLSYGDRVTFSADDVTLADGDKYYVRGIRESGRDNNTVGPNSVVVTGDADYVVAYGILGDSVAYTVRYVDESGRELRTHETFYGNIGDKPVAAYRAIDGYSPQYYNITGTLKEDEAENIFTFTYARVPAATTRPEGASPAARAADAAVRATAPPTGEPEPETTAAEKTPPEPSLSPEPSLAPEPQELLDMDTDGPAEEESPGEAPAEAPDEEDPAAPKGRIALFAGAVAAAAGGAAAILALRKRRAGGG